MSRHLLPANKGSIPTATPGQWLDFTEHFAGFQNDIIVPPKARINVTSIPSPWARMLLFKEAIMDQNHMMHLEVMSSILDVLEIIFYQDLLDFSLSCKEIQISNQDGAPNKFLKILRDLHPMAVGNEGNISISLVIAHRGNDSFTLAGTSPYTLFFTPLDLKTKKKFPRYFRDEPVPLSQRPLEFQRWVNTHFLPQLRNLGTYDNLVNAFCFPGGICAGSDNSDLDAGCHIPSDVLPGVNPLSALLEKTNVHQIDSSKLLKPRRNGNKPPLVIDPSINLKGCEYYNGYRHLQDHQLAILKGKDRSVLPGEDVSYPWILPYYDFLQPVLIKYKYKLNDEFLVMGNGSNTFKYALPLTDLFFKYFSPEDADELISITERGANNIRVTLRIPCQDHVIEIKKDYTGAYAANNPENSILQFDELDDNTPLPHLSIWPKLHPQNWPESYYGLVYGKRFANGGQEVFSLSFKDADYKSINFDYARKSNAIEVYRFEKLPTYVIIKHNPSDAHGLLLVDHKAFPVINPQISDSKVGIDFGTSHTNIALHYNEQTRILQYSSGFKGKNQNTKDFISFLEFSDEEVGKDNLPSLMIPNLSYYFFPNSLSGGNTEHTVNLPLPTMAVNEQNEEPEAMLKTTVPFSKYYLQPYNMIAEQIGKKADIRTELKWDNDKRTQNTTKEYLRTLLALVKYELVMNQVNLPSVKYYWAYPKSFSDVEIIRYNTMWNSLLGETNHLSTDESKAALLYFDYREVLAALAPSMSIIIDIGGGSSDVSVWRNGQVLLLYSSLWAGKNLVGFQDGAQVHSVLYEAIKNGFNSLAGRYQDPPNFQTHLNLILSRVADQELVQHTTTQGFVKTRFLILYFFSALLYEVGLQCRKLLDDNLNSIDICLAGNGSRFVCWSSNEQGSLNPLDMEIYKHIIKKAMGLKDHIQVCITPSTQNKCEVAIGLCEGVQELFNAQAAHVPVIAENVLPGGAGADTPIPQFDSRNQDNPNQLMFNIQRESSYLNDFNREFFEYLGHTNLYTHDLRQDSALSDLNTIKNILLGNWDQLIGMIRELAKDNMRKYSSISSSVFILGMSAVMRRLHKYLSE